MNSALAAISQRAIDPQSRSTYLNDQRETAFFLWEFFRVQDEFLGRLPATELTRADVDALMSKARAHSHRLAESYQSADSDPARLGDSGGVTLPADFQALWEEHLQNWFWFRQQGDTVAVTVPESKRLPHLVNQLIGEMFVGANPSFMTYAGFTPSACNLLRLRATPSQNALLLPKLESVEWDACFCATEADAGSDLIAVSLTGRHIEGDVYSVSGHKKYITAGMHDLTKNTIYIVVGRIENVSPTSLSLSCFLVPRFWPEPDGTLADNFVACTKVEDKMGLRGCANTHLQFGHGGTTRSFLLGGQRNMALLQLSSLMRKARVGTGHLALALASSAYLHSVRYARQRVQGPLIEQASTPLAQRVPIIQHHDVQRMLLEMRAMVEGCRLLLGRISYNVSRIQQIALSEPIDKARGERHARLAMMFGPIAKAYISDEAWQVVTTAIQVHGAVGYLKDLPLEQYARDIKILSIWEGTNYIQAQDLIRSRLGLGRDQQTLDDFANEIGSFLDCHRDFPELSEDFSTLRLALDSVLGSMRLVRDQAADTNLSQFFTRLLESFGDVIVAWNLLEAATVALRKLNELTAHDPDCSFYRGKVKTARFFIGNRLPRVFETERILAAHGRTAVSITSEELGFVQ